MVNRCQSISWGRPRRRGGAEVREQQLPIILCVRTEYQSLLLLSRSVLIGLLMDGRGPEKERKVQEAFFFILMWHILLAPLKTQPSNQTQGDYCANIMAASIYFLSYNQFP